MALEPRHAPETENERRAFLQAERSFVDHYQYASTWGTARLQLSRDKLKAEVYRGVSLEPWRTLDLDALLG